MNFNFIPLFVIWAMLALGGAGDVHLAEDRRQ